MSPPAPSPAPSINSINRRRRSTVVSMHGSIVEDMTVSHNTNLGNSTASPMSCSKSLISLFLSKDLLESPALSTYLLIALADGVATLALFIPFTYLPDLAISQGVSAKQIILYQYLNQLQNLLKNMWQPNFSLFLWCFIEIVGVLVKRSQL